MFQTVSLIASLTATLDALAALGRPVARAVPALEVRSGESWEDSVGAWRGQHGPTLEGLAQELCDLAFSALSVEVGQVDDDESLRTVSAANELFKVYSRAYRQCEELQGC